VQQQLAGAGRVRLDVGGGGLQGGDQAAEQPGLAVLDDDIAVHQLHLAGAQALDLPALQHQAGLEALLDEKSWRAFLLRAMVLEGDLFLLGALAIAAL
jgi:hypothetical protein